MRVENYALASQARSRPAGENEACHGEAQRSRADQVTPCGPRTTPWQATWVCVAHRPCTLATRRVAASEWPYANLPAFRPDLPSGLRPPWLRPPIAAGGTCESHLRQWASWGSLPACIPSSSAHVVRPLSALSQGEEEETGAGAESGTGTRLHLPAPPWQAGTGTGTGSGTERASGADPASSFGLRRDRSGLVLRTTP